MVRGRLVFSVAFLAIATARTEAQNRGVYPLGMSATNSGVTPAALRLVAYVEEQLIAVAT